MARKRAPTISATEAAKTFGRLVDRVREERAVHVIERGGKPVAQIGPVSEVRCTLAGFVELLRRAGRVDEAYLDEVEAGIAVWNKPAVTRDPWKS
jgi:antitoxin (DNA-binding transcriptional repressor) of toxin-antitoxin stability system